jgi:hypothetical protein
VERNTERNATRKPQQEQLNQHPLQAVAVLHQAAVLHHQRKLTIMERKVHTTTRERKANTKTKTIITGR